MPDDDQAIHGENTLSLMYKRFISERVLDGKNPCLLCSRGLIFVEWYIFRNISMLKTTKNKMAVQVQPQSHHWTNSDVYSFIDVWMHLIVHIIDKRYLCLENIITKNTYNNRINKIYFFVALSMSWRKIAVTLLLAHWSYCSLALSHWYDYRHIVARTSIEAESPSDLEVTKTHHYSDITWASWFLKSLAANWSFISLFRKPQISILLLLCGRNPSMTGEIPR